MDATITAQVLSTASTAVTQGGLTATQLAMAGGLVASHAVNPFLANLSDKLKPLVAGGSAVLAAAVPAMATGVPLTQALGYGVTSAATAYLSHLAFFKNGGILSVLQGALQGLQKPQA